DARAVARGEALAAAAADALVALLSLRARVGAFAAVGCVALQIDAGVAARGEPLPAATRALRALRALRTDVAAGAAVGGVGLEVATDAVADGQALVAGAVLLGRFAFAAERLVIHADVVRAVAADEEEREDQDRTRHGRPPGFTATGTRGAKM